MSETMCFTVTDEADGTRIDRYLADLSDSLSRSYISQLIAQGNVTLNGNPVKASTKVTLGDIAQIIVPEPILPEIVPENLDLNIRYEDDDILIVYKPRNMVVHPAPGNYSGTLVNGLMYHLKDSLSGINGALRPGIVHRIDKNTSGLLVVCKNDTAHRIVAQQLKDHTITRRYLAVCCGNIKEEGIVDRPIGRSRTDRKKMAVVEDGRSAVTHYRPIENFDGYTLVECRLETGRTHQIRVHMSSIGHPVLGDDVYGGIRKGFDTQGQILHAFILGLNRPSDGKYIECREEPPEYFRDVLEKLGSKGEWNI